MKNSTVNLSLDRFVFGRRKKISIRAERGYLWENHDKRSTNFERNGLIESAIRYIVPPNIAPFDCFQTN